MHQMTTSNVNFDSFKNLIALCMASLTVTLGFGVILPFFPLYASEILSEVTLGFLIIGIALQIGIMVSAFTFTRFLLAPIYGDLSDSIGRKPIILVGMSVYGLVMMGFGFAFDFFTLLFFRALQGVASAAVWPVGEALVVDTAPEEKVGRNLGYYIVSMQAGLALGPFAGFFFYTILNKMLGLPEVSSYRLSFICVGVLGFLATLIIALLVKDPSLSKKITSTKALYFSTFKAMTKKTLELPKSLSLSLWRLILHATRRNSATGGGNYRNTSIYILYSVAIVTGFCSSMIFPIISLFMADYFGLEGGIVALIIGFVGVLSLTGAPIGGFLSDRLGRKRTVWISELVSGILLLLVGLLFDLIVLICLFVVQRFFFTIMRPSFRTLQTDLFPTEVRGKEFGIVQASQNFGSILGPIIGGALYDIYFMVSFNLGNGVMYSGAGLTFAFSGMLLIGTSFLLALGINLKRDGINYKLKKAFDPELMS
ncbi:MAG: MFS transporter [Candidatus Hermodarchaeota archaeon]